MTASMTACAALQQFGTMVVIQNVFIFTTVQVGAYVDVGEEALQVGSHVDTQTISPREMLLRREAGLGVDSGDSVRNGVFGAGADGIGTDSNAGAVDGDEDANVMDDDDAAKVHNSMSDSAEDGRAHENGRNTVDSALAEDSDGSAVKGRRLEALSVNNTDVDDENHRDSMKEEPYTIFNTSACSERPYTYDPSTGCDGWTGISLDECEQKCSSDATAKGCPGKICRYAEYTTSLHLCHLYQDCGQVMERKHSVVMLKRVEDTSARTSQSPFHRNSVNVKSGKHVMEGNKFGPRGPPGVQGSAGPPGPPGVAGPPGPSTSQANSSNSTNYTDDLNSTVKDFEEKTEGLATHIELGWSVIAHLIAVLVVFCCLKVQVGKLATKTIDQAPSGGSVSQQYQSPEYYEQPYQDQSAPTAGQ